MLEPLGFGRVESQVYELLAAHGRLTTSGVLALTEELEKDPGAKILLKGDNKLNVGDVRRVLDIARKSKAKSIALGVEEKK